MPVHPAAHLEATVRSTAQADGSTARVRMRLLACACACVCITALVQAQVQGVGVHAPQAFHLHALQVRPVRRPIAAHSLAAGDGGRASLYIPLTAATHRFSRCWRRGFLRPPSNSSCSAPLCNPNILIAHTVQPSDSWEHGCFSVDECLTPKL